MTVSAEAVRLAGLSEAAFPTIRCGIGIAGLNRLGIEARLEALDFPFASLRLHGDAMIAHLGAHLGGDGAILILGTGSVGLVRRGPECVSIGGYGFPISDEGSGAALGLSAIRHALRALRLPILRRRCVPAQQVRCAGLCPFRRALPRCCPQRR